VDANFDHRNDQDQELHWHYEGIDFHVLVHATGKTSYSQGHLLERPKSAGVSNFPPPRTISIDKKISIQSKNLLPMPLNLS